jgi:hypothetical protein
MTLASNLSIRLVKFKLFVLDLIFTERQVSSLFGCSSARHVKSPRTSRGLWQVPTLSELSPRSQGET